MEDQSGIDKRGNDLLMWMSIQDFTSQCVEDESLCTLRTNNGWLTRHLKNHPFDHGKAFSDSEVYLERSPQHLANQPNETNMNDLESDDESVYTPLVSPFPHSDNDLDDGEVLNELSSHKSLKLRINMSNRHLIRPWHSRSGIVLKPDMSGNISGRPFRCRNLWWCNCSVVGAAGIWEFEDDAVLRAGSITIGWTCVATLGAVVVT
ncbi:hypothetical protein Tco_0441534 [Tanacetum coccineum]